MPKKSNTRSPRLKTPARRGRSARRWANFLLMPQLQIKLGAYMTALAVCLIASMGSIIYLKLSSITGIIIHLTDIEDEVREALVRSVSETVLWLLLAVILYVVGNLVMAILYTHKLIGPTFAMRRHIRHLIHGDYLQRLKLRQGDAFDELGNELNLLAQTLEEKIKVKKP